MKLSRQKSVIIKEIYINGLVYQIINNMDRRFQLFEVEMFFPQRPSNRMLVAFGYNMRECVRQVYECDEEVVQLRVG